MQTIDKYISKRKHASVRNLVTINCPKIKGRISNKIGSFWNEPQRMLTLLHCRSLKGSRASCESLEAVTTDKYCALLQFKVFIMVAYCYFSVKTSASIKVV